MGKPKVMINIQSIKENSIIRFFLICILVLTFNSCNSGGGIETTTSSLKTMTEPSGYLQVSVSPGDINARIGETVIISCSIMSLINTEVNISSIELILFDSSESQLRTELMNSENQWSANVTYTIVGDEAFYRLLIKYSINPANPEYISEYTNAFVITISS